MVTTFCLVVVFITVISKAKLSSGLNWYQQLLSSISSSIYLIWGCSRSVLVA